MSPSEEQLKAAIKGGEAVVWDDDGPSPVPPKRVYNHYVACEGVCKLMHGSGPLIKSVKHPRAPGRGYRSNGQRAAKLKAPVGVLSLSHYPSLKAAELLAKEQAMASVKEKVGPRGGVKRFLWCKVHQSVAKGLAACEKYMAGA